MGLRGEKKNKLPIYKVTVRGVNSLLLECQCSTVLSQEFLLS
jgi:hypothetical protein